ncbi:MAG TPA: hypothetical protein VHZ31_04120 [Solirubrobacteraceae bacterium]|jgi:hypothetical protein|nr:hypothetical protein [Solirubrobacteraceae bacterium]
MLRAIRRIAPFAVLATFAAVLAIPASSDAASTTICKLSTKKAESLGTSYVLYADGKAGYKVSATSCATGLKVVKAFQACRRKHGKAGRCTTAVVGFKCTEKRPSSLAIPTQFTGVVSCKKGSAKVTHTYQQNL